MRFCVPFGAENKICPVEQIYSLRSGAVMQFNIPAGKEMNQNTFCSWTTLNYDDRPIKIRIERFSVLFAANNWGIEGRQPSDNRGL